MPLQITISLLCNGIINAIFLPSIIEIVIPTADFDISFDPDQENFNYEAAREETRYAIALDELGIDQAIRVKIVDEIDFSTLTQANNPTF